MPDRTQLIWFFFRFKGRVNRAAYFLGWLFVNVIQVFPLYRFTLVPEESAEGQRWALLFAIVLIVSIWSTIALTVKRLHDIGRPGIISAALVVPVISLIAFVALCVMRGDPGPNRYGREANSPA